MDLSWKKLKMKMKTWMNVNQTKNGQKLTFNIWLLYYHPKSENLNFGNIVITQNQTFDILAML